MSKETIVINRPLSRLAVNFTADLAFLRLRSWLSRDFSGNGGLAFLLHFCSFVQFLHFCCIFVFVICNTVRLIVRKVTLWDVISTVHCGSFSIHTDRY